jgi:ATP-dependent RNA helicase RhlE
LTSFSDLGLAAPLLEVLAAEQYDVPTAIQLQAIPHVLAGRDLIGIAQTGTGKTAAFSLPILHRLNAHRRPAPRRGCRVLVLAPTRELATQIDAAVRTYGRRIGVTSTVVFGGVGATPQVRMMAGGVDVLVATPGRLLDLMQQGSIRLDGVEVIVLDEVDRMLDMGFIAPVRRIVAATPSSRQTLLFSATMPPDIRKLAAELLDDPVEVAVTPVASTVDRIDQRVIHVAARDKPGLLTSLLSQAAIGRALVFTRTKRGADRVARHLSATGLAASAIHGNKSQGQREQALAAFRSGRSRVLVATDIAARGIDIDGITHVINFELPNIPESYVHRIGRTARAGATGIAISFCDVGEREHLREIEKLIRCRLSVDEPAGRRASTSVGAPEALPLRPKTASGSGHRRPPAGKTSASPLRTHAEAANERPLTSGRSGAKKQAARPGSGSPRPAPTAPGSGDRPRRRLEAASHAGNGNSDCHDLSHLSFLVPTAVRRNGGTGDGKSQDGTSAPPVMVSR